MPADHKHIAWLVVCAAIVEALEELKLDYPKIEGKALENLKAVERALKAEKPGRADKAKANEIADGGNSAMRPVRCHCNCVIA